MANSRKIVTINGASNVGKTTVSELIALTRPMTVAIECDVRCVGRITRHIHQPTKDYVIKKFGNTIIEDCATLTINWLDRECDVIIPAPIPLENFKSLRACIDARLDHRQVEYHCFTLKPPIEVSLQNRGTRILTATERTRIRQMYSWLYDPGYGMVLDNQHQTPEQTAAFIVKHFEEGSSAVDIT